MIALIEETLAAVARHAPWDPAVADAVERALDDKTKPRGSLGRLEELARRYAAIRGQARPAMPCKAIVVCGADHGVADEGVSAYPAEVTRQMLLNFANGGAAINALARQASAEVIVVDVGTREPAPAHPALLTHRVRAGTASFARGPAMTRDEAERAIAVGIQLAHELDERGVTIVGLGEMGIGNTTAASAVTAALLGCAPEAVTGRGTGVDAAALARKIAVIARGLEANQPNPRDPIDVLAKVGGLEIAALAGLTLGAAARRMAVVTDGFIATTAVLAAVRLAPACAPAIIASHLSVEPGHRAVLAALDARPLFDLELRLGEGSGAALALPLVDAAVRVLLEMATFSGAGVTDRRGSGSL